MPPPFFHVGIVPRRSHPAALQAAHGLCRWLEARGRKVFIEDGADGDFRATRVPGKELARHVELLVVLGGDGTLIHAASLLTEVEIPIFGVNMGTLGFLTEIPVADMYPCLAATLEGEYELDFRMKLDAALYRGEGPPIFSGQILNDVVLSKAALARIADIEAFTDDGLISLYKADGVILATPTGSTAYSLSAHGPIIHPSVEAMVLSPICPHTLTQRPLVIPPDRAVQLTLLSDNSEVHLTLDGQSGMKMEPGDRVQVRRARTRTLLVRNPALDYFNILRTKLRWGER